MVGGQDRVGVGARHGWLAGEGAVEEVLVVGEPEGAGGGYEGGDEEEGFGVEEGA